MAQQLLHAAQLAADSSRCEAKECRNRCGYTWRRGPAGAPSARPAAAPRARPSRRPSAHEQRRAPPGGASVARSPSHCSSAWMRQRPTGTMRALAALAEHLHRPVLQIERPDPARQSPPAAGPRNRAAPSWPGRGGEGSPAGISSRRAIWSASRRLRQAPRRFGRAHVLAGLLRMRSRAPLGGRCRRALALQELVEAAHRGEPPLDAARPEAARHAGAPRKTADGRCRRRPALEARAIAVCHQRRRSRV